MTELDSQQQGCGVVNLFVPLFMAGGAVFGWVVGRPYGIVHGVLGSIAGVFLGIPALGLVIGAILGTVWLVERMRCR